MPKRSSKKPGPKDLNQLAKSIVDRATGQAKDEPAPEPDTDGKNPAAVALGKLGGKKGGPARAKKLTKAQRSAIAKTAAEARWGRRQKSDESPS